MNPATPPPGTAPPAKENATVLPQRLSRDIVYKRLQEMQTIFVERMQFFHSYVEEVDEANRAMQLENQSLRGRLDRLERQLSPLLTEETVHGTAATG